MLLDQVLDIQLGTNVVLGEGVKHWTKRARFLYNSHPRNSDKPISMEIIYKGIMLKFYARTGGEDYAATYFI